MRNNVSILKAPAGSALSRMRRWASLGVLSVADQVLFSGSNFLVNILLARWLVPDAYGAFAIAFSLYLAFAGVVCSLTLDPMLIYGSTDFRQQIDDYLSRVSYGHLAISLMVALVFVGIGPFVGELTRKTLLGAAAALPFMLMVWFVRRALYAKTRIAHAVVISGLYALVLMAGVCLLKWSGALSSASVYLAFILASLGCVLYYRLVAMYRAPEPDTQPCPLKTIINKHWNYGKWIILASMASSVSTLLYPAMLGMVSRIEDAAVYKGIQNLTQPFVQVLTALTLLLLPVTSRIVRTESMPVAQKYMKRLCLAFGGGAALYGIALTLCGKQLLTLLYANSFYTRYYWLIPVFSIFLVITAMNQSLAIAIRVREQPRIILVSKILAAIAVVAVGVVSVPYLKLYGVLLCMFCCGLVEAAVLLNGFFKSGLPKRGKADGKSAQSIGC